MLTSRNRRSGFTLPEVLVTVAIVAVLAAVVVPAVTQQLAKADAPSFNSSVGSLRTAITSFVTDVRRLPGKVQDLEKKPLAGTDFDLSATGLGLAAGGIPAGTVFTTSVANRWRGPYENSSSITGQVGLGYGWSTTDALYDSSGYIVVAISKAGADSVDALELDIAIDGATSGPNSGLVRWKTATAGSAPLNPLNTIRLHLMSSVR